MTIQGTTRQFQQKFKFRVEIDGVTFAAFKTCSKIQVQVGVIEHREGGALIPDLQPGLVTVPPVTLTRGVSSDRDLYLWMQEVVSMSGIPDDEIDMKRSVDIVQLNRNGRVELKRWTLVNAFPIDYSGGEWDNDAEENTMEEIILRYDYAIEAGEAGVSAL